MRSGWLIRARASWGVPFGHPPYPPQNKGAAHRPLCIPQGNKGWLVYTHVENRLDRKPEGFLIGLLRSARTSLSPTAYGLKLAISTKSINHAQSVF